MRGGGHNGAGLASVNDGLIIDLSSMNKVTVDSSARMVRVQGGAKLGEVDTATHEHGLAVPGWDHRHHRCRRVDARRRGRPSHAPRRPDDRQSRRRDGRPRRRLGRADRRRPRQRSVLGDSRRRWQLRRRHVVLVPLSSGQHRAGRSGALRPGRRRRCAPLVPRVLARAASGAERLLRVPLRPARTAVPGGAASAQGVPQSSGAMPATDDSPALREARSFGKPLLDGIAPVPMPAWNSAFDPIYPAGDQWYWRGEFVREITERRCDRAARGVREAMPTWKSTMHLYPIDGAAVEDRQRRHGLGISRRECGRR